MTQLSSKINFRKIQFLWVLLSFCNSIIADDSIQGAAFYEFCKTSNAYLLYSYTDVSYSKSFMSYFRKTSKQSKLVINNRSGVEEFAFLYINKEIGENLAEFQIRTLKSDGTIVELDSSLVFKHQSEDEFGLIKFPIPGVEPGDTIETTYVYTENLKSYELGGFVNLYDNVPCIKSEFTVRTTPDLVVRYKEYNGFPKPQILTNDTIVYCLFRMENVNGISKNNYTCMFCEFPYLYYSVDRREGKIRTWKDVYNQEFNFITQPILLDYEKSSYYRKWKKRIIGEADDSSKYHKFNLLYDDILRNFEIEPVKRSELIKSSGYFLKNKHFDPISIRRLYRQLLEDLEIEYWAVFARSKQAGSIDPYYIRKGEYDHILFAYENNNGSLNLLYPHNTSFKYQINEIPTSLYNTQAVIAKPFFTEKIKRKDKFINYDLKLAEVDSVNVRMIQLPGLSANSNYLRNTFFCNVDMEKKNATFKSSFYVSGGLSTDLRSFFSQLDQNKETSDFYEALAKYEGDKTALEIDTITSFSLKPTKPFVYKIIGEGNLEKSLLFLNDSIVSITLEKLIQHSQIKTSEDSTKLNYFLDYSYSDLIMIIFDFPCEIELISFDNLRKGVKNNSGEYLFSINKNQNKLILQSSYKILKDMIPKEEYGQLKQLNELVREIKNMRLMVKLKDSK